MDTIVDTQILSYRFKDVENNIHAQNSAISSITANEFLLAQPRDLQYPDYYVLHPVIYSHLMYSELGFSGLSDRFSNTKWAKRGKQRTDQVIIDFGNQFPPYQEFGNEAISEIINGKLWEIYKLSISHLPKQKQKYLKKRLKYILDNDYHCYPLNKSAIERALNLFSQFTVDYNCKGNIRNTINDILILATAIEREKKLLTRDSLLNRFTAERYDASIHKEKDKLLIDFSGKLTSGRQKNTESKGYINRGWSYSVWTNRTVQGT